MADKTKRLKGLEKDLTNVLSVFTTAVDTLEKTTVEYTALKMEIEADIKQLNDQSTEVDKKIDGNNKLLSNFKKLLGGE